MRLGYLAAVSAGAVLAAASANATTLLFDFVDSSGGEVT
jgi:hypothetical protein